MKITLRILFLMMCIGSMLGLKIYADQLGDEDILGILMTADKAEMDTAQQAMGKNISPDVKAYAQMIFDDHSADYQKLQDLSNRTGIQPSPTAGAMIKANEAKDLAMDAVHDGSDFESVYLEAMIKDHTDNINLIDTQLIPNAQNADLKAAIADARTHMVMHLDKAKELEAKLSPQ